MRKILWLGSTIINVNFLWSTSLISGVENYAQTNLQIQKKSNLNWKKWVIGWLTVKIKENHKITAWIRLEGTTVGHLVQIACSSMVTIEHIAQACIQKVLEYLQWKWTFNSYSIIIYLLCSAVADLITEDFQETRFLFWHFFFHCTNLGSQHHKNKWLG